MSYYQVKSLKSSTLKMEKNTFIKILTLLVLAYLHKKTKVCATLPEHQARMLDRVTLQTYWEEMWFTHIDNEGSWYSLSRLWDDNSTIPAVTRLKMVSLSMGCAYGVKLNYYHLLTFKIIAECKQMQQKGHYLATDCENQLQLRFRKGKLVVLKVIGALKRIYSVIDQDVNNNQFYQILWPLDDFLKGPIDIEFSGILPGGLYVNTLFNDVAVRLGEFLVSTCRPKYELFDITAINDAYIRGHYQYKRYAFYLRQLDGYIDYIEYHLTYLGFAIDE